MSHPPSSPMPAKLPPTLPTSTQQTPKTTDTRVTPTAAPPAASSTFRRPMKTFVPSSSTGFSASPLGSAPIGPPPPAPVLPVAPTPPSAPSGPSASKPAEPTIARAAVSIDSPKPNRTILADREAIQQAAATFRSNPFLQEDRAHRAAGGVAPTATSPTAQSQARPRVVKAPPPVASIIKSAPAPAAAPAPAPAPSTATATAPPSTNHNPPSPAPPNYTAQLASPRSSPGQNGHTGLPSCLARTIAPIQSLDDGMPSLEPVPASNGRTNGHPALPSIPSHEQPALPPTPADQPRADGTAAAATSADAADSASSSAPSTPESPFTQPVFPQRTPSSTLLFDLPAGLRAAAAPLEHGTSATQMVYEALAESLPTTAMDGTEARTPSLAPAAAPSDPPTTALPAASAAPLTGARVCHTCSARITESEYVSTGGRFYHQQHFTCGLCGVGLRSGGFVHVDSTLACSTCAVQLKQCVACRSPISTASGQQVVGVDDQTFSHMRCFVCTVCHCSLAGVPMHLERATDGDAANNKFYCETHAREHLVPKYSCVGCGESIKDRVLLALDNYWHPLCFQCCCCLSPLEGIPFTFHASTQSVYCVRDYQKLFAAKCFACALPLSGGESVCLENAPHARFHPGCMACTFCQLPLKPENFYQDPEESTSLYCQKHYEKFFLRKCDLCAKTLSHGSSSHAVKVSGKTIHQHCFRCHTCAVSLSDCAYGESRGEFFCEQHLPDHTNTETETRPQQQQQQQAQIPPGFVPAGTQAAIAAAAMPAAVSPNADLVAEVLRQLAAQKKPATTAEEAVLTGQPSTAGAAAGVASKVSNPLPSDLSDDVAPAAAALSASPGHPSTGVAPQPVVHAIHATRDASTSMGAASESANLPTIAPRYALIPEETVVRERTRSVSIQAKKAEGELEQERAIAGQTPEDEEESDESDAEYDDVVPPASSPNHPSGTKPTTAVQPKPSALFPRATATAPTPVSSSAASMAPAIPVATRPKFKAPTIAGAAVPSSVGAPLSPRGESLPIDLDLTPDELAAIDQREASARAQRAAEKEQEAIAVQLALKQAAEQAKAAALGVSMEPPRKEPLSPKASKSPVSPTPVAANGPHGSPTIAALVATRKKLEPEKEESPFQRKERERQFKAKTMGATPTSPPQPATAAAAVASPMASQRTVRGAATMTPAAASTASALVTPQSPAATTRPVVPGNRPRAAATGPSSPSASSAAAAARTAALGVPSVPAVAAPPVSQVPPAPRFTLVNGSIPPSELPAFLSKGIEATLAGSTAETVRPPRPNASGVVVGGDYQKKELYNILHAGISVQFTDYAPRTFAGLRSNYGLSQSSYTRSLVVSGMHGGSVGDGKSGMLFFFSHDARYVVKTVKKEELAFFRTILAKYVEHVCHTHRHTLLPRFFGLYKLSYHLKAAGGDPHTYRIVVMNNLFDTPPGIDISLRFDLKGSTRNREVAAHLIKPGRVLLDLNWNKNGLKMRVGADQKVLLIDQIKKDCAFLREANIMDHSLLLGIADAGGRTDYTMPIDDHSLAEPLLPDGTHPDEGALMSIWQAHRGGVRGFNPDIGAGPSARRELYFLGIIDILQEFNHKKAIESAYKTIRFNKNAISAIESRGYNERFIAYMESIME